MNKSIATMMCEIIALMMDVASMFETLVDFYQSTICNNPENNHLDTSRPET
jgi:hypothetical protein